MVFKVSQGHTTFTKNVIGLDRSLHVACNIHQTHPSVGKSSFPLTPKDLYPQIKVIIRRQQEEKWVESNLGLRTKEIQCDFHLFTYFVKFLMKYLN